MTTTTNPIAGVARSAMLVDLNIKVYSGRKKDKYTQERVVIDSHAGSSRASSVYKNLFADCAELDAISKFQAKARAEHYRLTIPWSDNGSRLLPTKAMLEYKKTMNVYQNDFYKLVNAYLDKYDTLVAKAAFQLGTLFDRDEYPQRDIVEHKFAFFSSFMPLPTSGDFRLDVESEVQRELIEQYERSATARVNEATQDLWDRLHGSLTRLSDRLVVEEDGKKRKFHDTMVTGALELCELLTTLNVANDPTLEKARRQLEDTLHGVEPSELRKHDGHRMEIKQKVDSILEAFDWGLND